MKKLIFATLCFCMLCAPAMGRAYANELSADAIVCILMMATPRVIEVNVTVNNEPLAGELVTFNRMMRVTLIDEEGNVKQDFIPVPGTEKFYQTNPLGKVFRVVSWGRFKIDVQEESQEIAAGQPFRLFQAFFNID